MNKYGNIHAMSDFVQATFPRARSGEPPSFAKMVLIGLMRLDAVQQKNQLVTLSVSTGGGIWVTYAGIRYLVIIPAQRWLRIVSDDVDDRVSRALDKAARRSAEAVEDTTGSNSYRQWNVYAGGLDDLWNLVESLPAPSRSEILRKAREHRNFPGSIRQAALEMFRLDGSICPGVSVPGKEKKSHKLRPSDKIEFDHILPHALGGSRGQLNIQVLCEACNRIKSATAY